MTNHELGEELRKAAADPYNSDLVVGWAHDLYWYGSDLSKEQKDIVYVLMFIKGSEFRRSEFAFSQEELLFLADKLMKGEKDPLQQACDMKKKREFAAIGRELGKELQRVAADPYDCDLVARWAYDRHCYLNLSKEQDDIIYALMVMNEESEPAFSQEELLFLADKLIKGEKNPLQ